MYKGTQRCKRDENQNLSAASQERWKKQVNKFVMGIKNNLYKIGKLVVDNCRPNTKGELLITMNITHACACFPRRRGRTADCFLIHGAYGEFRHRGILINSGKQLDRPTTVSCQAIQSIETICGKCKTSAPRPKSIQCYTCACFLFFSIRQMFSTPDAHKRLFVTLGASAKDDFKIRHLIQWFLNSSKHEGLLI